MVDSEYSPDNYKFLKISIGSIMKNLEMLRFVLDRLKTKMMCKHAVKQLAFVTIYVPGWYKTQEMYDRVILENGETLMFVPNYHNNQKMCNKAVDNYPHTLEFAPDCFKTRKM